MVWAPDEILAKARTLWDVRPGDLIFTGTPEGVGPVQPGGKVPELLRRHQNLYCDWSAGSGCRALTRDPVFAKEFLDEFQDRVLYARDYFDSQHQDFLNSLGLPTPILEKIYHANAEKLVCLD